MTTTIALRIADRAREDETAMARMLGHEPWEVNLMGMGAFCGAILLAYDEDRPIVLSRFRRIRT